jgi:hypothetical protein
MSDKFTDLEILNGLRDPWGWKQEDLNTIRLKAADRIDDLKAKNKELLDALEELKRLVDLNKSCTSYMNSQEFADHNFKLRTAVDEAESLITKIEG